MAWNSYSITFPSTLIAVYISECYISLDWYCRTSCLAWSSLLVSSIDYDRSIISKCRRRLLCWNSRAIHRRLGVTGEFPCISATINIRRTWRSLSTIPTIPDDVCMKLQFGLSPSFVENTDCVAPQWRI